MVKGVPSLYRPRRRPLGAVRSQVRLPLPAYTVALPSEGVLDVLLPPLETRNLLIM